MSEAKPNKVGRALGAMRDDVWTELQHRRGAKRLDEALVPSARTSRTRPWVVGGMAAAVAVAALLLVLRSLFTPTVSGTGAAVGNQLQPARALLADGSVVDIDRGGRIRVVRDEPDQTRIEVLAGRAEFEVQKRPGRLFVAVVHGVEVRVVGTHFSTELDSARAPGLVRIRVQRGTVEVAARQGERVARLNAGDSLEVSLQPAPPAAASAEQNDDTFSAPSAAPESPTPATLPSAGQAAALPNAAVDAAKPVAAVPDASKLFELASEARRSGKVQAAVDAYATLLTQFPSDERAGVAALELGRLRMDSLHAYPAAAAAFRRAIAAAPNEGIREDAMARLVEVLDRMHDQAACLAERHRYQARYPLGVHSTSVKARCAETPR